MSNCWETEIISYLGSVLYCNTYSWLPQSICIVFCPVKQGAKRGWEDKFPPKKCSAKHARVGVTLYQERNNNTRHKQLMKVMIIGHSSEFIPGNINSLAEG